MKYQQLSNYQAQGNYNEAAKRDEELMLKNMAERETKEFQDVQRKHEMELRNRNDTNLALRL